VSDATAAYQRLLKAFPSSIFAADAKRRLAALAEGGTSDFYQWFASFDRPKPKDQKPRDTGTLDDELDDDLLRRVLQNSTGGALPAEGEATEGSSETDPADDAGTGSLTPPAPADEAPADSATLPDVQPDDSTGSGDQSNTTPPEGAADDAAVPVEESPPESP
jgi:hypothetical protein